MPVHPFPVTTEDNLEEKIIVCKHFITFACLILPAENVACHPSLLCNASVTNLTNISPLDAVSVIFGLVVAVNPFPGWSLKPLVEEPSNTWTKSDLSTEKWSKFKDKALPPGFLILYKQSWLLG